MIPRMLLGATLRSILALVACDGPGSSTPQGSPVPIELRFSSNTASESSRFPDATVSATSEYRFATSSGWFYYRAFNAFDMDSGRRWASRSDDVIRRLELDFGASATLPRIVGYELDPETTYSSGPTSWEFLGSNDGVGWTVLDTVDRTGALLSEIESDYYGSVPSSEFRHYAVRVNSIQDGRSSVEIEKVILYEIK